MQRSFAPPQTAHAHAQTDQQLASGGEARSHMPPPFQLQASAATPPSATPPPSQSTGDEAAKQPTVKEALPKVGGPGKAIELGPPEVESETLPRGHAKADAEGGVVQRIIDPGTVPKKLSAEALEEYLYLTLINKRKQTFEMAVLEVEGGMEKFQSIVALVNAKNFQKAEKEIRKVIRWVNNHELEHPHHPNPVFHKGSKGENAQNCFVHGSPFAIPSTAKSEDIAYEIQTAIIRANILDPAAKFMLGVLVFPSGKILVGVSGGGRKYQSEILDVVKSLRYNMAVETVLLPWSNHGEKSHVKAEQMGACENAFDYQNSMVVNGKKSGRGFERIKAQKGRGKVVHSTGAEKGTVGSYIANCAAVPLLAVAGMENCKDEYKAKVDALGMTEVWISGDAKSSVKIINSVDLSALNFSERSADVTSCHVCQMQLGPLAKPVAIHDRKGQIDVLVKERQRLEGELQTITQKTTDQKLAAKDKGEDSQDNKAAYPSSSKPQSQDKASIEQEINLIRKKIKALNTGIKELQSIKTTLQK